MTTKTDIEQERADFKKYYGSLFDLAEIQDEWGNPRFKHEMVEAIWYGWRDGRSALQSQDREEYVSLRTVTNAAHGLLGSAQYERLMEAVDHARRIEGDK